MGVQKTYLIKVISLLGHSSATSTDDGQELFNRIDKVLSADSVVELDFEGIDLIISAFMNAAIGQLYSKYEPEYIRNHINLKNLSNEDLRNLKYVTDTAKSYFKDKNRFNDLMKTEFGDE
jgi:hypothetical protein